MPFDDSSASAAAFAASQAVTAPVLALDLSSSVGVAYGPLTERVPRTTTWHLPHTGGEGARYAAFENELIAFIEGYAPIAIVVEHPLPLMALARGSSDRIARQQYTLEGIARKEAYRASAGWDGADVHTIRSEVMGVGRYSRDTVKREVVLFCKRRGIRVGSHHAGDAALVWLWYRQRMLGIAPCAGPLWREAG